MAAQVLALVAVGSCDLGGIDTAWITPWRGTKDGIALGRRDPPSDVLTGISQAPVCH